MQQDSLIYGAVGIVIGGLLVLLLTLNIQAKNATAAVNNMDMMGSKSMSMNDMTKMLKGKTGDAFDKEFLSEMIAHHQGAIDMARLAEKKAKHAEIRNMAKNIINAQQGEIDQMKGWAKDWKY